MTRRYVYRGKELDFSYKTILCGIVNVTPDSFSDGGKYLNPKFAVTHALELVEQGAGMLDIGGESTRPGAELLSAEEEIKRLVPVIRGLRDRADVPISVDTWKSEVAEAVLEAGADIINDITGLMGDSKMSEVIAKYDAGCILMFNPVIARPEHEGSKIFPKFVDRGIFTAEEYAKYSEMSITDCMKYYFEKMLAKAERAGIKRENIMLDCGIGFGLTKVENLDLVNNIDDIHDMGYCSFLGVSRKRFVVNIIQEAGFNVDVSCDEGFKNRDLASSYLTAIAAAKGVDVLRVHSIKEHKMALSIAHSLRNTHTMEDKNFGSYAKK